MRRHFLRWWFQPRAALLLAEPDVRSVTLAVAQYWDDEADDAVHAFVLASAAREPGWPVVRTVPSAEVRRALADLPPLYSDNYDMIVAFAAYCRSGAHQEMRVAEAALPYAIARQGGAGVEIEVVGAVKQPAWEDRFLRPSRASRLPEPRPTLALAERAWRGEPLPVSVLLKALDAESTFAEGRRTASRLSRAARQWVNKKPMDGRVLAQVDAWLNTWRLR